jgi:hypothetical protein
MALTFSISPKELERQSALSFEGRTLYVMLCNVAETGYDKNSTVADWQSTEVTGNGYIRWSGILEIGSYNLSNSSYDIPSVFAEFSASSAGYSYDTVIAYLDGETYIHSLFVESPNIPLIAGQNQTYKIQLRQR